MRRLPRLAAVRPLPSEETTPPVTKICLVTFAGAEGAEGEEELLAEEISATGFHAISAEGNVRRAALVDFRAASISRRSTDPFSSRRRERRLIHAYVCAVLRSRLTRIPTHRIRVSRAQAAHAGGRTR